MTSIELTKLSAIPYLDIDNLQGRFISTLMFCDKGNWRTWFFAENDLIEIKAWPAEGFYFSTEHEPGGDIYFHFMDFIAQRASFPEVKKAVLGLRDDLLNIATSIAKLDHIHRTSGTTDLGTTRMASTEIEYIAMLCRSVFDLLQEVAKCIWNNIQLHDQSINKKPLKKKFSEMVLKSGEKRPYEEYSSQFGLPSALAKFYDRNFDFFSKLRAFRDNIAHNGSQIQTIFHKDDGFFISKSISPLLSMTTDSSGEQLNNNLIPLIPVISAIVFETISTCEEFSEAITETFELPPPIAPGMRLYMRSHHSEHLSAALSDGAARKSQPAAYV